VSILRARLRPYTLPLDPPWPSVDGPVAERRGWIVALEDDAGRIGLGDAAPFPGFGLETHASSGAALRGALRRILGLSRTDLALALTDLSLLAPVAAAPAARNAIDGAIHDLLAQAEGVPLARYLGGAQALPAVSVNAVIPRVPAEEAASLAREAVEAGFTTIKLKVGGVPPPEDRARLEAVRTATGAETRIRIDANQGWSADEAIEALRSLAPLGIEYVEQPVAADDMAGMKRVREVCGIPVAADESLRSLATAETLLYGEAADLLVVKPMAVGGLRAARGILTFASERGAQVVVTHLLESAVGRAASIHFAAALGPTAHAHGVASPAELREDLAPPAGEDRGSIRVPEAPGLGVLLPAAFWEGAEEIEPS